MPKRLPASPGDPGRDPAFWVSRRNGRKDRAVQAAQAYDGETLGVLANAFRTFDRGRDALSPDGKPMSTGRVYRVGVDRWVAFAQEEGVDLLQPEADDVVAWVRDMEGDGDGLITATVTTYLAGVRWLYTALRRLGVSTADPARDVKVKADGRASWDRRTAYAPEEADRLIDTAVQVGELALALAVSLGADAGLRASEIVSVTFQDFNLETRMVRIGKAKRSKSREAALLPRAAQRLAALLPVADRTQPVFGHTTAWLRLEVKRLSLLAGVPYRGVHSLRHLHAMSLAQRGVPIQTLASQLGHSSTRSTEVYVKLNDAAGVHRHVHDEGCPD